MVTQLETLTFERTVQAPASEVFRAFTNSPALQTWLCNRAEVEPRRGGPIYLWWNKGYYASGVYTELEKDKAVAFTWRGANDPAPSEVRVAISAEGVSTTVKLQHGGFGDGPEWESIIKQIRRGWEISLENLQAMLEKGVDLRLLRRPMFGLSGADEINSELATQLGVPVSSGLRLTGLVDGMGAQKAGVQTNDVIVRLGDHEITSFPSIGMALDGYHAGDKVPVVLYRGPEQHTIIVELSGRPVPEVPVSAQAMLEASRKAYATTDAEMDALFAGVTEEEADYRPGPGEWNAKEVLAHLIAVERDVHFWIACMNEDLENLSGFQANQECRVKGIVAAYPTASALTETLKHDEVITLAMIEALPKETAAHKDYFNQLAVWMGSFADHNREHFATIKALVEKARAS